MIIQVVTTVTTEKEINFPYVTFNEILNTYYYNYKENSCIMIKEYAIEHYDSMNFGLDQPEAKPEEAFKLMDSTILTITEALNK
jgi:hypothetical protein